MANRNTEDIDQLFREGLNPKDDLLSFPEADWSKLEKRLIRHDKRKRGIIWLSRIGGVAALLLLFFAIRLFLPEERKQVAEQTEVQQKEPRQASEQAKEQPKDQKVTVEQKPSNVSPEAKESVSQTEPATNRGLAQSKSQEAIPAEKRPSVPLLEKETAEMDTPRVADLNVPKATTEPSVNVPSVESKATQPSQPDSIKVPDPKAYTTDEPLLAAIDKPMDQPIAERKIRKMALSVLAAPDYNGVDNLNNASLGSDFGLLVSFAFAKNWSFSTGGIYAKKLYEADYRNYNPARNIWTEYYPRSVTADCRVLDIPLNISYTFLQRKNSSISAGSGISSYIMLKEDYRFTYTRINPDNPQDYQVVNENQHWLSVLNLQATFEQRLNSKLSVSLQPYMKIPLSNIGFAGVKLQTLGMAANLSWNFNL